MSKNEPTTPDLKLSLEDIEAQERFKDLSPEQKQSLIEFIYQLSLILYHLKKENNE